ncbi:nitroreductase family protein [Candidatus Solincola sp.]|nr:nitroreductase family protein [Actinomycetota bacterium]MDI7251513.1 nitroreductase family protein [Actinomycetota bacterium]
MELRDVILGRRSIRRFLDRPLSEEDTHALLEAGRWAPSGLNNQPWRVVLVEDRSKAADLSRCTRYSSIVAEAPLLIAVFLDHSSSYDRDKDVMSVGAFIQNILLAAHDRGLGAVWLGEILREKERVRELLEVPPEFELMAVIAVGYPAESPARRERKALDELIYRRY